MNLLISYRSIQDNIKVMNSIISLAHSLDLSITAEGIEDSKQYDRLKAGGCDYIQGYYFSKPLEIDMANEIYKKGPFQKEESFALSIRE